MAYWVTGSAGYIGWGGGYEDGYEATHANFQGVNGTFIDYAEPGAEGVDHIDAVDDGSGNVRLIAHDAGHSPVTGVFADSLTGVYSQENFAGVYADDSYLIIERDVTNDTWITLDLSWSADTTVNTVVIGGALAHDAGGLDGAMGGAVAGDFILTPVEYGEITTPYNLDSFTNSGTSALPIRVWAVDGDGCKIARTATQLKITALSGVNDAVFYNSSNGKSWWQFYGYEVDGDSWAPSCFKCSAFGCLYWEFDYCDLHDANLTVFTSIISHLVIRDTLIHDSGKAGSSDVFGCVFGGVGSTIDLYGCVFYNNSVTIGGAHGHVDCNAQSVRFESCSFKATTGYALDISGSYAVIICCAFYSATNGCIHLASGSSGARILYNAFTQVSSGQGHCIIIDGTGCRCAVLGWNVAYHPGTDKICNLVTDALWPDYWTGNNLARDPLLVEVGNRSHYLVTDGLSLAAGLENHRVGPQEYPDRGRPNIQTLVGSPLGAF